MEQISKQKLCDFIHFKYCYSNHTDGCGYGYEKWDDLRPNDLKTKLLKRVNILTDKFHFTEAQIKELTELFQP